MEGVEASSHMYLLLKCLPCPSSLVCTETQCVLLSFKNTLFIYFRQRGREGERDGEKHHVWLPLVCPLLGTDLTRNPGMCPDWELNQRPFDSQASAQSSLPHQ